MTKTVIVTIATYQRPQRLRLALESLRLSASSVLPALSVGVTVVDDDPNRSAREVASEFANAFPLGCTYVFCGSHNISHARNAGLEAALMRADWVGSIDDDVEVPANWFRVCADALSDGKYNAVTGPLIKDFSMGPRWLTEQPFGELGLMAGTDGEASSTCATGNNWVSSTFLRRHPTLRFNPELGRTGGEDMDFFYRAIDLGLRPVFSESAAVIEREPVERCTFRYQLRRAFWLGISEAQTNLRARRAGRARLVARALRRAANAGARQLSSDVGRSRHCRYEVAVLVQCWGVVLGTLGVRLRHR